MDSLFVDHNLTLLPVVHGSASYAVAVRRYLLENAFDCIAVPLPPTFRDAVLAGVGELPTASAVVQRQSNLDKPKTQTPQQKRLYSLPVASFVPIDPCQPVIAAIRFAMAERVPIVFIGHEGSIREPEASVVPDPFALRTTTIERYCAATLPAISPPHSLERRHGIRFVARQSVELRTKYKRSLLLCDLRDWPWLREEIRLLKDDEVNRGTALDANQEDLDLASNYAVDSRTLLFLFGELPFITGLYERARQTLDDDSRLVVDGIKELLVSTRQSYVADLGNRARKITPMLLSQCLKFIRNQTLLDRQFSPSFYTIARSSQQVLGDQYTIHLVEAAQNYPFEEPLPWPTIRIGIEQGYLPVEGHMRLINRLAGPSMAWQSLELNRPPIKADKKKWSMRWNPYQQCSWPDEDTRIESFRNRVVERAQGLIGADLARSEKFTTSLKDGLDLRETLRHWYDGSLYVKVNPPNIGTLDAAVMLFDNEPDPQEYSWRATWFAEHDEESTLAFYATPYQKEMLGPGVAVSTYGGAMFLFPPKSIADIWEDERLDFADTMEQRLVAAACLHSEARHVACLSWTSPGLALKKIAKLFKRSLVHVPLNHFSDSTVQQLRTFHVLNGKQVRTYAAHFIRKA
ncbi:MAG: hypothetical protein ABL921_33415 [Pirellula sp.]